MTLSNEELRAIKDRCLAEMRQALPYYEERLSRIDSRVLAYARDVLREDIDVHNLDEILCLRKFWRILDAYPFDYEAVRQVIIDAEGIWEQGKKGRWEHKAKGLKIDSIYGYKHCRLTPIQVLVYAWIYGPHRWVDTQIPAEGEQSRKLMPTERVGENGTIEDYKRLIRDFIMLFPRKVAKTFIGAFIQFEELMRGERDAEGYIASGSSGQSRILFGFLKNMVMQLDGWSKYFKKTDSDQNRSISWKENTGRIASVTALTAGGKHKDGLKASCCSVDEEGSDEGKAGNTSDMQGLVNVLRSSMGPRREPLTVHTSTAGTGIETPYEFLIADVHEELLKEVEIPLRNKEEGLRIEEDKRKPTDWQGEILLRPDQWERGDEDELRTERVIRKVNPNLGITIQPDFYVNEWQIADKDETYKKEVKTKLYNIFASDSAVDWVSPDRIRYLQREMKIEDCKQSEGWIVFNGLDFTNVGDDLQAQVHLAVRSNPNGRGREFFADMDLYASEEAVMNSPNKLLLLQWAKQGWLNIEKGKTFKPEIPVERCVALRNMGVNIVGFGYDQFKAKDPINRIKDWIVSCGVKPTDLGNYIIPIPQTFGGISPLLDELTFLINDDSEMLHFSMNPMWSWMAANCQLIEEPTYQLHKLIKRKLDNKIDGYYALMDALGIYDNMNSRVVK